MKHLELHRDENYFTPASIRQILGLKQELDLDNQQEIIATEDLDLNDQDDWSLDEDDLDEEADEELAILSPWGYEMWQKKMGKGRPSKKFNRCSALLT